MRKSIIYASLLSSMLAFTSCEEWLDVNQDPDKLGGLTQAEVLMPTAQVSVANTLMGWDLGITSAFWVQYYTQAHGASQFRSIDQYENVEFASTYQELTAGALNDFRKMKEMATASEDRGSYLVAEAMSIFTWQLITDTWGTVPYFEALRGEEQIYSPNFDKGEDIYADLLKRCDALLEEDFADAYIEASNDFIFGFHEEHIADYWVAFVKSLKLKLMLRLSETASFDQAALLTFVTANIDGFLDESAMIDGSTYFADRDGARHPQAEVEMGDAKYYSQNIIASKTFIDYLKGNTDPRLETLFHKTGSDLYVGAFQGDFFSEEDADGNGTIDKEEEYSAVSEFKYNDNLYILSAWENYFNIAEAYARNNDFANAKVYYDAAVKASLAHHGLSDLAIIKAGGYAEFVATTADEAVKQIAMQRWVAYAKTQHWEAFLERNRTKYPSVNEIDIAADRQAAYLNFPVGELVISVNGRDKLRGNLPASPQYPTIVLQRNTSGTKPGQKDDVGQKIWWDQKAGK